MGTLRIAPSTFTYREQYNGTEHSITKYQIERNGETEKPYHDDEDDAIDAAFPEKAYPKGPPMVYIEDGEEYCWACARKHFLDTAKRDEFGVLEGEDTFGGSAEEADRDLVCGECYAVILAQNLCPHHGADGADSDEDGKFVCSICAKVLKCPQCGEPVFGIREEYTQQINYKRLRLWLERDERYGKGSLIGKPYEFDEVLERTVTDCCGAEIEWQPDSYGDQVSAVPGDIAARDSL